MGDRTLPTAADYARSTAEKAKVKAESNEQKLSDIRRAIAAIGLGLFGREKFGKLMKEARELGF